MISRSMIRILAKQTKMESLLDNFQPIQLEKPSDIILKQVQGLIKSGELKPGDKLPPERILADRFATGRSYVREAIKKLEFYGILKTYPQSGTFVSKLGVNLIEKMITDVLQLDKDDFNALIETRRILEIEAARIAARRAEEEGIGKLKELFEIYKQKVQAGEDGLEEDLLFHMQIADLCQNSVLRSIILFITPHVVHLSRKLGTCENKRTTMVLKEHGDILEAICLHREDEAAECMRLHMVNTLGSS